MSKNDKCSWVMWVTLIVGFGSGTPFLLSAINGAKFNATPFLIDEDPRAIQVAEIFGVKRPKRIQQELINPVTKESSGTIYTYPFAVDYDQIFKNRNRVIHEPPSYEIFCRQISERLGAVNFESSGFWNMVVLFAGFCVAQWTSGKLVYYYMRDDVASFSVICVNCGLFVYALISETFWIGHFFNYYILPIPVILLWLVAGISYFVEMFDEEASVFSHALYAVWHYCGLLLLLNRLVNPDSTVFWLP